MKFKEYKYLINSDLYRITGRIRFATLIKFIVVGGEFKYNFWMRTCQYAKTNLIYKYSIYPISKLMLLHFRYKFGIRMDPSMSIGSGLFIGHFGGINVAFRSKIGKNLNISQQVTIGVKNRGKYKGYPVIGDNVYLGPGSRIIGSVKIGNNVAIGANCVVTKNIPDNSVVIGIPGRVISNKGTGGYVDNTDYDKKISN